MAHRRSVWLFLMLQLAAYAALLYLDLNRGGAGSVFVKYGSIALCLLFSLCWTSRGGDRLITAALAFTLGADTFLLLLDRWYFMGVLLFCVVQGLYLVRICRDNGRHTWWGLRLGLFALAAALLVYLDLLTALNLLALFYFSNFVCNALQSLTLPGRSGKLFFMGLCLFLCCDFCVGMFNHPELITEGMDAAARAVQEFAHPSQTAMGLYEFARVGMWLFYLPAQAFITLSGHPDFVLRGPEYENK